MNYKKNGTLMQNKSENNTTEQFSTTQDYVTTVTILESISDAIFILNTNGAIEYANKSAIDLTGIELKELTGKLIDEIIIENSTLKKDNFSTHKKIMKKFSKGIYNNIEVNVGNNGNITPVMLNFSVISNNNDIPQYVIVTARDMTNWKILEREIHQQQAVSISRDRIEMLGKLSISMVHEITQPLASIKMRTELLNTLINKENVNKKKVSNHLKEMTGLIARIENKIDNMRTYAQQVEENTYSMVDINDLIKKSSEYFSYELTENNIEILIEKSRKSAFIFTNKLMLQQVFINLIKNSIDAFISNKKMKNNRRIYIVCQNTENKWVEIDIEDNAGGIKPDIMNKIFDPFFTSKEPEIHSGIGLSLAQTVVSSLGGDISFNINGQIGTRFNIRIPLTAKDEQTQLLNIIEMLNQ